MSVSSPLFPVLLNVIIPLNDSKPSEIKVKVDYLVVDSDEYHWPVHLHCSVVTIIALFIIATVDSYFIMVVQNAISMFEVLGWVFNKKLIDSLSINFQQRLIKYYVLLFSCVK